MPARPQVERCAGEGSSQGNRCVPCRRVTILAAIERAAATCMPTLLRKKNQGGRAGGPLVGSPQTIVS